MTESPKLTERIFHASAHLMQDDDMTNEEVVRHITSWLQNTEVEDCGMFSQVGNSVVLCVFMLQDVDDMVISTVTAMDICTAGSQS